MINFLVTGSTGFVGSQLVQQLLIDGHRVVAAARKKPFGLDGAEFLQIKDIAEANWHLSLKSVDVVLHLAARVHVMKERLSDPLAEFRRINVAATEKLARSAGSQGVRRFVYVSSIKVHGEETALDAPFSPDDLPSPLDAYGISKLEAERRLVEIANESGMELVIVRPPLVYGAGVGGNFAQMIKVLCKGYPLPFASVHNLRSLIYVGNLVDALILCATHPAAKGQTYLVNDEEDLSTPALLAELGAAMGHSPRLLPFPEWGLKTLGQLTGRSSQLERLTASLRVDGSKIRRELGWMPPFSVQQGLRLTVADFLK